MFWESRSTSEGFAKCISTLTTVVFVSMAFLVSQSTSQKWSKVRTPAEGGGRGVAMPEVSRIPGKRRKKVSYSSLPYFGVFFSQQTLPRFLQSPSITYLNVQNKGRGGERVNDFLNNVKINCRIGIALQPLQLFVPDQFCKLLLSMTVLQTIDPDKFWKSTSGDFFSEFLAPQVL